MCLCGSGNPKVTPKKGLKETAKTPQVAIFKRIADASSEAPSKKIPKATVENVPKATGKALPGATSEELSKSPILNTPNATTTPTPKAKAKATPKAKSNATPKAKAKAEPLGFLVWAEGWPEAATEEWVRLVFPTAHGVRMAMDRGRFTGRVDVSFATAEAAKEAVAETVKVDGTALKLTLAGVAITSNLSCPTPIPLWFLLCQSSGPNWNQCTKPDWWAYFTSPDSVQKKINTVHSLWGFFKSIENQDESISSNF